MTAEKVRALVLRATPFGETSAIVTLLTREAGKVRGLAKGAWRPKSKFDAALDLLSVCQVLVLRRSTGSLDLLTEAFLEHRFRVGDSQPAVAAGLYLTELLDAVTVDADPQPALFDLATRAVRALSRPRPGERSPADTGQGNPQAVAMVLVHTELGILQQLGQFPALHSCAECGTSLGTGRVAFGMLSGGGLCPRCRRGKRAVVSVSPPAMALLRSLGGTTVDQPHSNLDAMGEVRAVMNTFLSNFLGFRLKTSRWLSTSLATPREKTR
jgi:DNA repair protein RecO (recombination protein O)